MIGITSYAVLSQLLNDSLQVRKGYDRFESVSEYHETLQSIIIQACGKR